MGFFRGLFDGTYRRARRAEGSGDYRAAAALYAEVGAAEEAANALLFLAARAQTTEERVEALTDSLRFIPKAHPRRRSVAAHLGRALLESVRHHGIVTEQDRMRVREGARYLEEAGDYGEAASAWERLGDTEEAARCLEAGGEVERLEALLEREARGEDFERRLTGFLRDHDAAMASGDRIAAQEALRAAAALAPHDRSVAALLRALESRWLPRGRVRVHINKDTFCVLGAPPVRLGRAEAELPLRGASVSRLHAELGWDGTRFTLRDLGSKNGTLVAGVPLGDLLPLEGELEVGLGSDVTLRLVPGESRLDLAVVRGVDRGRKAIVGVGAVRLPGLDADLSFPQGQATLVARPGVSLQLSGRPVLGPVVLLREDRLEVGGTWVEVL